MKVDNKKIILAGVLLIVAVLAIFLSTNMKTYTVTFDSKMGTSIRAQEVKANEVAEKPNDPVMTGYEFLGWYLNDQKYNFDTKITEDITLTAKWQKIGE